MHMVILLMFAKSNVLYLFASMTLALNVCNTTATGTDQRSADARVLADIVIPIAVVLIMVVGVFAFALLQKRCTRPTRFHKNRRRGSSKRIYNPFTRNESPFHLGNSINNYKCRDKKIMNEYSNFRLDSISCDRNSPPYAV